MDGKMKIVITVEQLENILEEFKKDDKKEILKSHTMNFLIVKELQVIR